MDRLLVGIVFLVGFAGLLFQRDLIKKVIALSIINSALVTLFILLGSRAGSEAPILREGRLDIVDPLVQALMLTAIVVGICITALALVLSYALYRSYGTTDTREIERLISEQEEQQ